MANHEDSTVPTHHVYINTIGTRPKVIPTRLGGGNQNHEGSITRIKGNKVKGEQEKITFHNEGRLNLIILIKPGVLSKTGVPSSPALPGNIVISSNEPESTHEVEFSSSDKVEKEIIYGIYCSDSGDWATGNSHPRIIIDP